MPPADHNRIEELKKDLYSRTAPDVRTRRKLRFMSKESAVKSAWERPPEEPVHAELTTAYKDHSMSFFKKLLIGSAIFCVIAVAVGAYLFFNGANLISANNIDIAISGPVSIPGGAPVSFDVKIINKNNVDLHLADMSVDFPAGATDPKDPSKELKSYRELIGDIPAGRSAEKTVNAIIFGEENLQKQIAVTVTYSVKGSTAIFTKTKTYDVLINSSPINVTVSSIKEVTSGQEFELKVNLKSNSDQTLKNVLLKASYPFGFTFASSDLKPLNDNATWKVGDIPAGGERTVAIRGSLQGENTDLRVFRFVVGAQSSNNSSSIGTEYMTLEQDITIEKPFISLDLAVNHDQPEGSYVLEPDQSAQVEIHWFNNLPVTVSNAEITVHLSGSAYDRNNVHPDQGFFRSATDDIVWNQQTDRDLASIGAGEEGTVSFFLQPKKAGDSGAAIVNPTITISASVAGNRTQETRVPEKLSGTVTQNLIVSSNVGLTGRLVRTVGPFTNTGPIPPRADQKSTYTVIWTVDNTSSSVSNAQVTASLPAYVKWLGKVSPSTENLTYDEKSGSLTWNIGQVSTYTAGSSRRREVSFQISFEPGTDQVGDTPVLVNEARLTARDTFTGIDLESTQEDLTTRYSTDPAYKEGDQFVK